MKLGARTRRPTLQDRLVWQCAATLLTYPDERGPVDELLANISGVPAQLLGRTAAALEVNDPLQARMDYVETFDRNRRCTMYLTYWTAGETRNRGGAMLAFATTYREAGVQPPKREAPDFLPVVLEFAATVDRNAGARLLAEHRVPIDILRQALAEAGSPYAHAVEAVCQTLPAATDQDVLRAQRLAQAGPPAEAVGLQPFTLTVPPRRERGAS